MHRSRDTVQVGPDFDGCQLETCSSIDARRIEWRRIWTDGTDSHLRRHGSRQRKLVAVTESADASTPFYPDSKPIDAYCAAILDTVSVE
jgi:hypothetical protein